MPEEDKAQIRDLTAGIGAVIGGAVGDSSYNAQLAGVIGKNAVENNQLKPTDSANYAILVSKYKKECEGGKTASHCEQTKNEILAIVNRGKTIAKEEYIDGGADNFLGKDSTVIHKPGDVVGCITIHGAGVCQVTNKQVNGEYVLSSATETQKNSYIQKNIESNKQLMRLASDAFNNGCASVGIVSTACSAAMAYYGVDPITKRKLTTSERTCSKCRFEYSWWECISF